VSTATRFALINSGAVDLLCDLTSDLESRRGYVSFSHHTALTPIVAVVKNQSAIRSFTDFNQIRVALPVGSTGTLQLRKLEAANGISAIEVPVRDQRAAFQGVAIGTADATVLSRTTADSFVMSSPRPEDFRIVDSPLDWEPAALVVGHEESRLLDVVNQTLDGMRNTGRLQELFDKWFGPLPHAQGSTEYSRVPPPT